MALGVSSLAAGALSLEIAAAARRVIVIGAGLSGLRTAMLLQKIGFEVRVVEGRNRVGGRVFTLDYLSGHPEAGSNVIGPNYGRILDVANSFGLAIEEPPQPFKSGYIINGERISKASWPTSLQNPFPPDLKKITPDRIVATLLKKNPLQGTSDWRKPRNKKLDISAADFFRASGLSNEALKLIDSNNSYGNSLSETSLLALHKVSRAYKRAMSMEKKVFELESGNMRLPERMASSLLDAPILGEQVVSVNRSDGFVRINTYSGREILGDAVVFALPTSALRKIYVEPQLPSDQAEAIEQLSYHKVLQLHLLAQEPFWKSSQNFAGYWTNGPLGRIFTRPVPDSDKANITIWINGDSCDQFVSQSREQAISNILSIYYSQVPEARGKVAFGEYIDWITNPFNEGAWAMWRPGDISRYADLLHKPSDRYFFAGEHTAYSNAGMEGAMESADRVVVEVLRALS